MNGAEAQWIARAREGDHAAFRCLLDANARALFRLCFRITGDTVLAEDAVQEAFYSAWHGLKEFDRRSAFSTWLHRIGVNAALEQVRSNARHRRGLIEAPAGDDSLPDFLAGVADDAPSPEAQVQGLQIGEQIHLHLALLSPFERAAFVMRHYEGERLESIAATLSMDAGQCKQAIFRAVRKLREALEKLR